LGEKQKERGEQKPKTFHSNQKRGGKERKGPRIEDQGGERGPNKKGHNKRQKLKERGEGNRSQKKKDNIPQAGATH